MDFVIGPDFPDSGHYEGLEGINRYMRLLLEPWDRLTIAAEKIEAVGDHGVIVAVLQTGTGSGSGIPTEFRYFHAWTFSDGKVVRWENTRDRESALAAAKAG